MPREMKDSGIEWIGEIPKDWEINKIKYCLRRNELKNPGNKQVLSVYREYGVIPKNSRDDNHNVTSEDTSKYKYVKNGHLVINKMKAWQGSMGVSDYEGIVSPAYFIYEFINSFLNKKYFHFLLRNVYKDEFRRISGGIREGQWDLSAIAFENEYIIIPPLSEQQKIVNFLNTKCSEIDQLHSDIEEQIEVLEKYKKSVITEAVTKGLNPDVEMKDSGIEWIGKIPKEWKVKDIKYLVKKPITDGTHQTPEYDNETNGSPFLSSKDVTSGHIDWSNIKYITKKLHEKLQKEVKPQKNDILLAKNGTIGIAAIVENDEIFDIYVTLALIRVNEEIVMPKYMLYVINSNVCKEQFNEHLVGIGVSNLHLNIINNVHVFIPNSLKEQQKIANFLDSKCAEIDKTIEDKKKQLTILEEYKKSLIYEYVTGKKTVP